MAFNPNYVPWMSILGVLGAGVGYLVGPGEDHPEFMIPICCGLVGGSMLGILVRIFLRHRENRKYETEADQKSKQE